MATASLVKGKDRKLNVTKALELIIHDLGRIREKKRILIKPNLTSISNSYANTNVEAVEAIIDFLNKEFTEPTRKEICILEGSGDAYNHQLSTSEIFRKFGYYDLLSKYRNVQVKTIDQYDEFSTMPVKNIHGETRLRIANVNRKDVYFISLAIPKTHDIAIATLGIKNMMGLIKQEDKSLMHGVRTNTNSPNTVSNRILQQAYSAFNGFIPNGLIYSILRPHCKYAKSVKSIHYNLLSLAKAVLPDLVVLDGLYGMEGNGPVHGDPVKLGICVASTDPVKADGIGVRIMGFNPEDIGYLYYAQRAGLGEYSTDDLIGERIENVKKVFRPHKDYLLQKEWR